MTICICMFPSLPEPSEEDKAIMLEQIRIAEEEEKKKQQAKLENSK